MFELANLIEAALWLCISAALLIAGVQRRRLRRLSLAAAVLFGLFGLSDIVEARTGAWWKPWWLLTWKVACVLGLLTCLIRYRRARAAEPAAPNERPTQ